MVSQKFCAAVASPPRHLAAALSRLIVWFASVALTTQAAGLNPANLRCEYTVNPLGVDVSNPRLFWVDESKQRGQKQTAYQILVASSAENLAKDRGDLWDSGKIASDETIQIPYGGAPLKASQQVFWKVRVWDAKGKVSAWSKPATWTMGLLKPEAWRAKWIAAPTNSESVLLRHDFVVQPRLKRALVNVCGLGQYELSLNGQKVGDDFLSPGWTKYNKTCLYDTFDVTKNLQRGKNAVGIELGNGMYRIPPDTNRFAKFRSSFGPLKAIAQFRLEYADGTVEIISTDDQWRAAPGPITFDSIYGGEDFDARLVQHGWDEPGFDDSKWETVQVVDGPGGELKGLSCAAPPIREFQIHRPVAVHTLTNGDVVYDLGQNASHVLRISVHGPAGSHIRLLPSELTNADGSINQGSMGGGHRGSIWCDFIKATDGTETWSPKFFYVGYRYVQVHFEGRAGSLLPAAGAHGVMRPTIKSLEGIVVHSASEPAGEFECSNDLFNRIFSLVRWAQENNMVSVLTDCPHRERLGWLEQDHLNGPALRYDFDLAQLFTKTVNDIADSQLTNGLVPTTAPEYTIFRDRTDAEHLRNRYGDSPEWSASFILIPWQQYEFDGDLELFRRHYGAMTNYLAYLGSRANNYILNFGLGDWYDLGPNRPGLAQLTPVALTATAFYFEDAIILSHAAALLGRNDDAKNFSALAKNIRATFNETFFNGGDALVAQRDEASRPRCFYATGSQCANAIPLVFGLCEASNRAAVVDAIVRDVHAKGLTAGDVGYRYLLRALADAGRSDVIFEMNNQTNNPGYGMQVAKGKTSLTEAWDGGSSQDHFMLGQIQEWFYHDLAGIGCDPAGPGFKRIIIHPQPVGDLTWVKAGYKSIRGEIVSDWKLTPNRWGEAPDEPTTVGSSPLTLTRPSATLSRSRGRGTSAREDARPTRYKFTLSVAIPPNTTATVFVPAESAEVVTENSRPASHSKGVKFLRVENGCAVLEVESGRYEFESKF